MELRGRGNQHVSLCALLPARREASPEHARAPGDLHGHRADQAVLGEELLEPILNALIRLPGEAEEDLLDAYDNLSKIELVPDYRRAEVVRELIAVYKATKQHGKQKEWEQTLATLNEAD